LEDDPVANAKSILAELKKKGSEKTRATRLLVSG